MKKEQVNIIYLYALIKQIYMIMNQSTLTFLYKSLSKTPKYKQIIEGTPPPKKKIHLFKKVVKRRLNNKLWI